MVQAEASFELTDSGQKAFSKLLTATNFFALGGIAVDGHISGGEQALIELLKEPIGEKDLIFLTTNGTSAGSLYALLGLKFKNLVLYKKQIELVKAQYVLVEVEFGAGCMFYRVQRAALIGAIDSGSFDSWFVNWKQKVEN